MTTSAAFIPFVANTHLGALVDQLDSDSDARVLTAIRELARLGRLGAITLLTFADRDRFPENEESSHPVIEALAPEAWKFEEELLRQLARTLETDAPIYAAHLLARCRSCRGLAALVEIVADHHRDADLRQEAARALGEVRHEKAVDALGQCLLEEEDGLLVRERSAFALARIGGKRAASYLGRAFGVRHPHLATTARDAFEEVSR